VEAAANFHGFVVIGRNLTQFIRRHSTAGMKAQQNAGVTKRIRGTDGVEGFRRYQQHSHLPHKDEVVDADLEEN